MERTEGEVLHVATGRPYDVVVGAGVSAGVAEFVRTELPKVRRVALVADSNLERLHAGRLAAQLEAAGLEVGRIVFPAGERSKTLETFAGLVGELAGQRLTRSDLVVALGGGVTGDLAGFAAAAYLRGIDFLQVPTSLLAMVDSSVGGKTGVDLPEGKNLVGAFHQPRRVFCDTDYLETLPEDWYRDGMGEVLKYAVLGDADLFARLEAAPTGRLAAVDIVRCIGMKRDIVGRDEFEGGERRLLNLGHTYGHAIERLSGYRVSHGRAVATGVAFAARAAAAHGRLAPETRDRIVGLVGAMGFDAGSDFAASDLAAAMAHDKKCAGAAVTLVLPRKVGACEQAEVPLAELLDWLIPA